MRILLAIDDSACSAAAISAVVSQFSPDHAEVQVLHADEWPKDLPPAMAFAEGPAAADSILGLHDTRLHRARALVTSAAQQLRAVGFATTTLVREGDPRNVILEYAKEWGADVVVLGSHGKRGLDRLILGSVSDSVARHAQCSVEIVRTAPNAA